MTTGPQPGTLSGRGQEGGGSKWLYPTSQMSLQGCLETSVCPAFSHLFFTAGLHSLITSPFLPSSSPSSAATAMGTTASAVGTTAADAAVKVTPGPAPDGEPRTPEGVCEDVMEEYEEEPEVAAELVPEVVRRVALTEGAMITVRTVAAPPPSYGARAPLSSTPHTAAASGAATGAGMEMALGNPTPYALGDISMGEAVSTAHQALFQAQRVLHREGEDVTDERQCL
jgi:hypothetical protein